MDWNGLIMAGGSELACLSSIPADSFKTELRGFQSYNPFDANSSKRNAKGRVMPVEVISSAFIESNEEWSANLQPIGNTNTIHYRYSVDKYFKKDSVPMDSLGKSYFYDYRDKHPFCNSDIDLFIYGMSEEEGEQKIRHIYETIKKNSTSGAVVVRTGMAITIQVEKFRPIQIILRLYKSPSEVLMGFDLDCCVSHC